MKLKRVMIGLFIVAIVLIFLLLPAALDDQGSTPLVGPDLSALVHEEIRFDNDGLFLAGMIFVPDGEGPFPVVVIIHGSGTSRRNNAWYLSVTRYLQKNGVAVLLPDKRGSEKSEGDWVGADFHELAGDTLAAVEFVRSEGRFADSPVGLVGMSQGGWIAPVVAAEDQDIAFVVSMSGSTVPTDSQLLHEEIHNISEFTWPFIARLLAPITAKRIRRMDHFRAYAGFDPIPYWQQVEAPKFFAFGGNDPNVPVEDSLEALRANSIGGLVKVYPDGGHAIRDRETNSVSGEFLHDLVVFVSKTQVLPEST